MCLQGQVFSRIIFVPVATRIHSWMQAARHLRIEKVDIISRAAFDKMMMQIVLVLALVTLHRC